jgi:hypothetical protein
MMCTRCGLGPDQACLHPTCPRARLDQAAIDQAELAERGQASDDPATWPQEFQPVAVNPLAEMHEQLAWNDMRDALCDGRHVLLQLDPDKDWTEHARITRWRGGVVGHWSADEDTWIVTHDPSDVDGGSHTFFDSRWFTGWKHLPPVTFEADTAENTRQPQAKPPTPPPSEAEGQLIYEALVEFRNTKLGLTTEEAALADAMIRRLEAKPDSATLTAGEA